MKHRTIRIKNQNYLNFKSNNTKPIIISHVLYMSINSNKAQNRFINECVISVRSKVKSLQVTLNTTFLGTETLSRPITRYLLEYIH